MAKPKKDEISQKERFIEQARKSEADESGETFERAFKKIIPPRKDPAAKES
jgi:hypothetical protein